MRCTSILRGLLFWCLRYLLVAAMVLAFGVARPEALPTAPSARLIAPDTALLALPPSLVVPGQKLVALRMAPAGDAGDRLQATLPGLPGFRAPVRRATRLCFSTADMPHPDPRIRPAARAPPGVC
jgi:hypothetical protein